MWRPPDMTQGSPTAPSHCPVQSAPGGGGAVLAVAEPTAAPPPLEYASKDGQPAPPGASLPAAGGALAPPRGPGQRRLQRAASAGADDGTQGRMAEAAKPIRPRKPGKVMRTWIALKRVATCSNVQTLGESPPSRRPGRRLQAHHCVCCLPYCRGGADVCAASQLRVLAT